MIQMKFYLNSVDRWRQWFWPSRNHARPLPLCRKDVGRNCSPDAFRTFNHLSPARPAQIVPLRTYSFWAVYHLRPAHPFRTFDGLSPALSNRPADLAPLWADDGHDLGLVAVITIVILFQKLPIWIFWADSKTSVFAIFVIDFAIFTTRLL
jgi:hypothetical protein